MKKRFEIEKTEPVTGLVPQFDAERLINAWRLGRTKRTLAAYDFDLKQFQRFTKSTSPKAAAGRLIANGPGPANELVDQFKAHMVGKNYSSSTINRRLSALRSVIEIGQRIGLIHWSLSIDNMKNELRKDVRGPESAMIDKLFKVAGKTRDTERDTALLLLLFNRGLRRESVANMELSDVDLKHLTIRILLKGHREHVVWTIPKKVATGLERWIKVRGSAAGSLFDLHGGSIWRIIKRIGAKAGIKCWPHALRHSAATQGYEATKDLNAVQLFLGHASPTTTARYLDQHGDKGGDVSKLITDGKTPEKPK